MLREECISKLDVRFQKAYYVLYKRFDANEFRLSDAETDIQSLWLKNSNEVMSEFKKAWLLGISKDPADSRKSIYVFNVFEDKINLKEDKSKLFIVLKSAADLIRTTVDYEVLLIFLFYKAISDKWNTRKQEFLDKVSNEQQANIVANSGFYKLYNPQEDELYTWQEVTKDTDSIRLLYNALMVISELNKERFGELSKLLEKTWLWSLTNDDNMFILESLVSLFDSLDFSGLNYDMIGEWYMWILSYFAPQKAKEGEVYTPKEISTLISKIIDIQEWETILDPACGSGSMLIEAYDITKKKLGKESPNIELHWQERNEKMEALGKINFVLHGIDNFSLDVGDSLKNPRFVKCDKVIANPPWNLDGYNEDTFDDSSSAKKIYTTYTNDGFPSKQSADWAWVQLMLYYSKKKSGIVLDSGALFRWGREKKIRQAIIEKNLIDAVILLPEKLFYNTSAPGIILVLNHERKKTKKDIMFVNASDRITKHPDVRKLNILAETTIEEVLKACNDWKDIEWFSKAISIDDIAKNEYNLNVSLYINPIVIEEQIDLAKEFEELKELDQKEKEILEEVYGYIDGVLKVVK